MPISEVFEADIGLGGVLSLLWFRRRLPDYATKFIEMILMVRCHDNDVMHCIMYYSVGSMTRCDSPLAC